MAKSKHLQIGGLFEDWLKDEGLHEEVMTASVKRVLAWQLAGHGGRQDHQNGDGQAHGYVFRAIPDAVPL